MSGQPVNKPSDINKFRNEYMETLNLQEQINDMNLQANKNYLLTGQLPPQSQMQDTRTTAEKLKDVEMLKHKIAEDLRPIAEPQFAYSIVNAVMNSPLNIDNSLVRFLAQRAKTIASELSKNYTFGIAGDANDLQIIVEFIRNMYSEQQGKFQSVKSYMNSRESYGSSSSKILSVNDIDSIITQLTDIIKSLNIIMQKTTNRGLAGLGNDAENVRDLLIRIKDVLPNNEEIQLLLQDIENPVFNNPYPEYNILGRPTNLNLRGGYNSETVEAFYKLMEQLPKYNEVNTIMNKIKRSIDNNDTNVAREGLNKLNNLFSNIANITNANLLNMFKEVKDRQQHKIEQTNKLNATRSREFIRQQNERQRDLSNAQKVYVINPNDDPVWVSPSAGNAINLSNVGNNLTQGAMAGLTGALTGTLINSYNNTNTPNTNTPNTQNTLNSTNTDNVNSLWAFDNNDNYTSMIKEEQKKIPTTLYDLFEVPNWEEYKVSNKSNPREIYDIDDFNFDDYDNNNNYLILGNNKKQFKIPISEANNIFLPVPPMYSQIQGNTLGFGLKKRRQGRPRGSGLPKPIPPPKEPTFVGFGISEINRKNLDKGIFTIRRNTKTNYMDMPSRHISKNLQSIIKTMIGGGVPKYEDLGKLDEDEKEYLHKIVSKSNMEDKLSVPAPSKDQQEKDIHNFEVMKGQIMAGNDNKDLVKKFKLLIRKLSKQGLLPKNDVEEINDILTDLDY